MNSVSYKNVNVSGNFNTFGPGPRTNGVLDHIERQIIEVRNSCGSSSEWVDLVILSLDGLTRQLWSASNYNKTADEIAEWACDIIRGKQGRNELRSWPDWRQAAPDKAIEHDRSKD
jgi:hypothetical protein